jgi:transcriptional regulator with XRE-family HTH domain
MVGVFQSEISEIECGRRKPSIYLAKRIAKALGISLDDLFLI